MHSHMMTYGEMMFHAVIFLLSLTLVFRVLRNGKKQGERPRFKLPPGPRGLPIIGNLHQLGLLQHRSLLELSKRYGPLMHLQLGRVPVVVVSSAEMAKEVLKTHDLKLCSRPSLTPWKRISYNFSDVALAPYSAAWRETRKISVVSLLNAKKVEGFRAAREEEVERMMIAISSLASLSKPINLSKLLHSLSNGITCRAAFGKGFHNGRQRYQEKNFYEMFSETQELLASFFVADYIPWAGWADVCTGLQGRLEKNFAEIDAFCKEVIVAHRDPNREPGDDEDLVDVLLRLREEDAHLTDDHVKGVLMDILFAGTDTSSTTLDYAMAELMRNPNTMLKAQEEVRSIVGAKGKVEESDLPHLSYLKSIVKETLRLHAVAPLLIPRETMEHVNINGYDILPKTRVLVNAWAIGRDPASWEKPEEFVPERFMDSTIDFRGHDFQFIPFGAGRRICPGMTFGLMTVDLALANLLYAFNWEVPAQMVKGGINMDEATGLAVRLKNDLQLMATKYKY